MSYRIDIQLKNGVKFEHCDVYDTVKQQVTKERDLVILLNSSYREMYIKNHEYPKFEFIRTEDIRYYTIDENGRGFE